MDIDRLSKTRLKGHARVLNILITLALALLGKTPKGFRNKVAACFIPDAHIFVRRLGKALMKNHLKMI
jgi:hypothetical protein